ncbi:folate transporter 1-like isoform X2 [Convolutriloba macropyga]|uniref:folate transporter 1-like isoform X2 n=1 Tax=Convolutriloba macropyga TaxID=536237 RepID=UPI003F51CBD3
MPSKRTSSLCLEDFSDEEKLNNTQRSFQTKNLSNEANETFVNERERNSVVFETLRIKLDDVEPLSNVICWKKPQNLGLFYCKGLQAFTENITMWRPAIYPFFGVYLNMPGHRYNAINSIFALFWSFKFFWGLVSDSWPILGKARIYYMVIGFLISGIAYLCSALLPTPDPYYSYSVDNCTLDKSQVSNPGAPDSGMVYIAIIAVAVFATGIADLAGDALVVDYTREEQDSIRGRTNAWTYICSRVGTCIHYLIIGLALNSPAYGGTFCNIGVSYQHVLGVYSATGFIAAFCALTLTVDRSNKQTKESLSKKLKQFWVTVQSRLFQRLALMFIIVPGILSAKSSALVKIRKNWAKVDPLMGSLNAVLCSILAGVAMYLFQRVAVGRNWVKIFIISQLVMMSVGLLVESLTIFDVIRSQFFYFSEDLVVSFASGLGHFIMLQLAAEIAESGLEAMTFGVLMTNWTMSTVLSSVIGNILSVPFGVIVF